MDYYTHTAYRSDNIPEQPPAPERTLKDKLGLRAGKRLPHDSREVVQLEYAYNYVPSQEIEREKEQGVEGVERVEGEGIEREGAK